MSFLVCVYTEKLTTIQDLVMEIDTYLTYQGLENSLIHFEGIKEKANLSDYKRKLLINTYMLIIIT